MTVTRHARDLARRRADVAIATQKAEYRRKIERIQGAFSPPLSNAELSVGLDLDPPDAPNASTLGRFVSESPRLARARPDSATRALLDALLEGEILIAVADGVPSARRQVVVGEARDLRRLGRGWVLRNLAGGPVPETTGTKGSVADWDDGQLWDLFEASAPDPRPEEPADARVGLSSLGETLPRRLAGRDLIPIGLGAMRLSTHSGGARPTDDEAIALLHEAWDLGVRLVDTADVYSAGEDDLGHNEELIRRALASWSGSDGDVLVATKAGLERPGGRWRPNGRPEHLRSAVEASLRRLGVEQIELLQLHAPDPRVPLADSVGALAELQAEGKIRHVGLCNVDTAQLDAARTIAPIAAVQVAASIFDPKAFETGRVVARCHELGIPVVAHSPLGGHRRAGHAEKDAALRAVADRYGSDPWQVALAWLLAMGPGIVPIPGATRPASLRSSVAAADLHLDDDDFARLEAGRRAPAAAQRRAMWSVSKPPAQAVLLLGPPASGKTSRVDAYVARGYQRLNRDEAGGKLADLEVTMRKALEVSEKDGGPRAFVLDNTYPTKASRSGVLDLARQHGLETVGLFLDAPLGEVLLNACQRMIERHGRVLTPDEIKVLSKDDPNMLPPAAIYRYFQQAERPAASEGFDRLETIDFVRRKPAGHDARALLLDLDGTVRRTKSGSPFPVAADDVEILPGRAEVLARHVQDGWKLLGISNQSGIGKGQVDDETVRAAMETTKELLAAEIEALVDTETKEAAETVRDEFDILYCPFAATPSGVWCRKPMPGMVAMHLHKHRLDRDRCVVVGDLDSDRELAELCSIPFRWAEEFFGGAE